MAKEKSEPQNQNTSADSTDIHSCPTCSGTDVLRARIDAAAQAQKRSRAAFLASTIMSVAILIAMWNAYGSWYRSFLFKVASDETNTPKVDASQNIQKTDTRQEAQKAITQEARKTLIDEWIRNREIILPILGIKAGIGDGAVVGSVSIYIVCIWVLLSMRRENHIIGILLEDTSSCLKALRISYFTASWRSRSSQRSASLMRQ